MNSTDELGYCICLDCNTKIAHTKGKPCREENCPQCGKKMIKEGNYHHQLYLLKTGGKNENSSSNTGQCC